jgi:hypothetical protein
VFNSFSSANVASAAAISPQYDRRLDG